MGISSAMGPDALRAGVCTSTTRPASPFEGQMIYETDTNRVLVWDNSAWVMIADTDQPPSLQLIKTQTVGSSVASVQLTSVFGADFESYRITINNVQGSAGADLRLTFGNATSGYYYGGYKVTYGGSGSVVNGSNAAFIVIGHTEASGSGGEQGLAVDVFNPNLTVRTSIFSGGFGGGTGSFVGGMAADNTQYTSFTITPSTGTLTGGAIRVYGYRNS